MARSALAEAAEQLSRALAQIAALPATPALRREQIKLQVALITPLIHVKGFAAPETKKLIDFLNNEMLKGAHILHHDPNQIVGIAGH